MLNMHSQSVTVRRVDLLDALHKNLEAHRTAFAEAIKDYQALVMAQLHAALQRAQNGDFSKVDVVIPKPDSHERDFIEVIEMMEISVDETIKLDTQAFRAYFKNDWPWRRQFDALVQSYKTGGVGAAFNL